MSTRGYNSYHGRGSNRKVFLVVILLLVLLAAVAYLLAQNYIVYDAQGNAHLELPFSSKSTDTSSNEDKMTDEDTTSSVSVDDVNIEYVTPEFTHPEMKELHATEMPRGTLWWNQSYILSLADEDMAIHLKRSSGKVNYKTTVDVPAQITVEGGNTATTLASILESDKYVVGIMSCFLDNGYANNVPETSLQTSDGNVWSDANGQSWLDPSNSISQNYITSLCSECTEMGIDEIAFEYFSYPSSGDTSSIAFAEDTDKSAVLSDFAESLRKNLPDGTVLSIILYSDLDETSGLTAELLEHYFDRIYISSDVNEDALLAQLPSDFDASVRLVKMVGSNNNIDGSYLILDN